MVAAANTTNVVSSGGLLTTAFLDTLRQPNPRIDALGSDTFAPPSADGACKAPTTKELEDNIATSWELLVERWDTVRDELHGMDAPTGAPSPSAPTSSTSGRLRCGSGAWRTSRSPGRSPSGRIRWDWRV
ncbi:MAG: hypothetical protein M3Q03_17185, partial [Chloroflexota bacterium]|nr:hypothetical protein [Chloroflexota bacterium]